MTVRFVEPSFDLNFLTSLSHQGFYDSAADRFTIATGVLSEGNGSMTMIWTATPSPIAAVEIEEVTVVETGEVKKSSSLPAANKVCV